MKRVIRSLYLNIFSEQLIAYVAIRLVTFFNSKDVYASIMGVSSTCSMDRLKSITLMDSDKGTGDAQKRIIYFDAFPRIFNPFIYRFLSGRIRNLFTEYRFNNSVGCGDVVYLFPGCSLHLLNKLKKKGCIIVVERINTIRLNSKCILDKEYDRVGIVKDHGITDDSVVDEIAELQLADFIFSPSPQVTRSIKGAEIAPEKIIATSYGLDAKDILDVTDRIGRKGPLKVLFVGSICLRKGVHLLLSAWGKAKINGELVLVGNISPSFSVIFNEYKSDPTIRHVPFVDDLRSLYQDADVFVIPSLEEGSPLVTYLALGAGLPIVASSMGGGGVVQDGVEGLIIDPHDEEQFVGALKSLTVDHHLRQKMATASKDASYYYTWDKVAARRRDLLFEKISSQQRRAS